MALISLYKKISSMDGSDTRGAMRALAAVIMLLLLGGSGVIALYLPAVMQTAAIDAARQGSVEVINQVKLMRGYYTQNVVTRALKTNALKPTATHAGRPDEIPLPATLVKDLSALMATQETTLNLISPYPWPHRADRKMDAFETGAWQQFQVEPARIVSEQTVINGKRVLRVAVADKMASQACVDCHNADPLSAKRNWKVGDVRAVFEVSRVIEGNLQQTAETAEYIVAGIAFGAVLSCAAIVFFLAIFENKTRDKRQADQNAYYFADHDALTGLKNRAALCKALDASFAAEGRRRFVALYLIDLDSFKPVNDTHGHAVGDQLLAAVAKRLRGCARAGDVIARIGGDEFAVAKIGPLADARLDADAEAIRAALMQPFAIDGVQLNIGASIGIALPGVDAENTSDLIIAADLALYAVKGEGKAACRRFTPDLTASVLKRVRFEADIKRALFEGQFHLHYQGIRDSRTNEIVKLEALLRWNHPERGNIPPSEFIPVAEESGLIVAIGAWAIERACNDAAQMGGAVKVAINLSTKQLVDGSLLNTLKRALNLSRLAPERLEVEITESIMLKNEQHTLQTLNAIRAMGIGIAIDDFGTGYSCLSYLRDYPVTCVKIDRSFVSPLGTNESAEAIVGAIIALASALKLKTVAEGVETDQQAHLLVSLGCDQLQGFYFDRPKPLQDIALLREAA